eukprot:54682-Lingulodinium_polyedra.AAC.1
MAGRRGHQGRVLRDPQRARAHGPLRHGPRLRLGDGPPGGAGAGRGPPGQSVSRAGRPAHGLGARAVGLP